MKVKWGILGAGNISDSFVSDFKEVHNGEVVAVAARSKSRAEEFAQKHNIEKFYGDYKEMLSNKEIDIIYIGTTHNFHYEHTKLCFDHGKSVLCEKPVTVNTAQFEELREIAKEKELFYMEAMWTYFLPAIKKVKEWIQAGEIGEVNTIKAEFGFTPDYIPENRLFNLNLAGGALLDIGIYTLAISNYIIEDNIDEVFCSAKIGETGVDEHEAITIKYENGTIAQLTNSLRNDLENKVYIYGSGGRIIIEDDFWMSKKVTLVSENKKETFEDIRYTIGYNYEATEVGECIIKGEKECTLMPLDKSLKSMKLMDELREIMSLKYPFE